MWWPSVTTHLSAVNMMITSPLLSWHAHRLCAIPAITSSKQKTFRQCLAPTVALSFANMVTPVRRKRLCSSSKHWRAKTNAWEASWWWCFSKLSSDSENTYTHTLPQRFTSIWKLWLAAADSSPLAFLSCSTSFNIILGGKRLFIFAAGTPHWYIQLLAGIKTNVHGNTQCANCQQILGASALWGGNHHYNKKKKRIN